jgi:hypothetical protein
MRKRYRILLLAALVAALAVPVGFALSAEPSSAVTYTRSVAATPIASVAVTAPVLVTAVESAQSTADQHGLPDAAKLFFAGTVLFGLAAAVRRAA